MLRDDNNKTENADLMCVIFLWIPKKYTKSCRNKEIKKGKNLIFLEIRQTYITAL